MFRGPPDIGERAGGGFADRRASVALDHPGFDGSPKNLDMRRRIPDGHQNENRRMVLAFRLVSAREQRGELIKREVPVFRKAG